MNFYQMDLQDYERYVRNNSITDDLTLAILEDLTDISRILENLEHENKSLQDELNLLKETISN